jgi:hypothetical protein
MIRPEEVIQGEQQATAWERQIPSSSITIGAIPFELSYRVWLAPKEVRKLDHMKLVGRSKSPLASICALRHEDALNYVLSLIWKQCLQGQFYVSGKRTAAGSTTQREFISVEEVNALWPLGPNFVLPHKAPTPYTDLEITGPAPAWTKLTIDENYDLPAFLVREFQHTDDYTYVIIRDFEFELGAAAANIVRQLHIASNDIPGWRYETDLRAETGCQDISDLFKRQNNWRELIQRSGRGRWRLNLRDTGSATMKKPVYYRNRR